MMDKTKLALKSDFVDYYDHWFYSSRATQCPPDAVFMRLMSQGMSRPTMMHYMRDIGFTTPRFGIVKDVCRENNIKNVVVHLDIRLHAGDGKVLMSTDDAVIQYPDVFAVEHIQSGGSVNGKSIRMLKVGDRTFWFQYSSENDWRSNAGNVNIEMLGEFEGLPFSKPVVAIQHSLFAIDFIKDGEKMYAIDFNESPGLRGTGIENVMTGIDVFNQIAGKYMMY